MADVDVQFGGTTDQLTAAANDAKKTLSGFDAVVGKIQSSFAGLAPLIVGALSITAIQQFASAMGDVGEQLVLLSEKTGVSVEELSTLSFVGKVTGSSMEDLSKISKTMTDNFDKINEKGSKAGAAIKALGLDVDELKDSSPEERILALADALNQFSAGENRTKLATAAAGDEVEKLVPLLGKGAEGFRMIFEEARRTGAVMSGEVAQKAADLKLQFNLFQASSQGLSNSMYVELIPALESIVKAFKILSEAFRTSIAQGGLMKQTLEYLGTAAKIFASAIIITVGAVEALGFAFQGLKAHYDAIMAVQKDVATGGGGGWGGASDGAAKLDEELKKIEADADKAGAAILKALQELWKPQPLRVTVHPATKPEAPGLTDDDEFKKSQRRQLEALEGERRVLDERKTQYKTFLDAQVALDNITATESVQIQRQKEDEIYADELALLNKEKELYNEKSLEWERVNSKIKLQQEKHNTEMLRLTLEQTRAVKAEYDEFFDGVRSAWDGQLRGLLAKQITWAQAFRSILGDLLTDWIKWGEKKLQAYVTTQIAEQVVGETTETAKAAAATTASAATLPAKIAAFTSQITASAAETFAGVFGFMAPFLGPAAAGPAAASEAAVLAQLAAVPKFATGMWDVPHDMLAVVHQGERITPQGVDSGGWQQRGGGGVMFNVSTVDPRSFNMWLQDNAGMIATVVAGHQRRNPSTRGKF